jgi:capsular exopolysaccharide synthesis family protein
MSPLFPPESEQKAPDFDAWPDASSSAGQGASSGYTTGGYGYGNAESEVSLVHYLQILYRRRYVALTAFVLVVLGAAVYTFSAIRIYEGTSRILIERENPNVVSFKEVLDQSTLNDDYYETQYQILQGRGLARRTIEALKIWDHPQFHPVPRWTVRRVLTLPIDTVAGWFEPTPPPQPPGADETQAQAAVIDRFLGGLNIAPVRFSRLVDITFLSPDPILAAKVPNALASQYMDQSVEVRSSTTKEASDFLTQQLEEQRKKVEASEQALQAYREQTDSVSLEERQNIVVQKLQDLNEAVTKANTTRIQKEGAYNQAKAAQENPALIDGLPLILSNTFIQQQKTELAQLQRQLAQLSERLGPNHPDMVKIGIAITNAEAKIQAEVAQVLEGTRREYEAALAEEQNLTTALNRQKAEAQSLNRDGIQYGVLQRDATANRQMFEALLQRTQETGVSEQIKAGNIRIIDQAEIPESPISPNVLNNLLIAIIAGLTLAVGLAFAFEYADDRIKNPDELKRHLGLAFLGMVPRLFDKNVSSPLVTDGISAAFAEAFRSLRTNVLFSSVDDGGRLIVITSSAPGEGKTIISSNLAVTLAQAGHRVLLIDGDMRKPRVHEVFKLALAPGLSNLLVGTAAVSEATIESKVPGLWLMSAGTCPPNPAELLGSKRFKDFTAFLRKHFDWVIIDTPPIMAVTDAAIVGNLSHGVLFVVGAEMTSRRVAQRAVEQLELGQVKFLGAVLNRVDLQHHSYYYSKYYRAEYGGYYGKSTSANLNAVSSASEDSFDFTSARMVAPFNRPKISEKTDDTHVESFRNLSSS